MARTRRRPGNLSTLDAWKLRLAVLILNLLGWSAIWLVGLYIHSKF